MDSHKSLKNKRVCITCGPTWTPIDDFRIISNQSTGQMGQICAQEFYKQGCRVTLIKGPIEQSYLNKKIRVISFRLFDELSKLLKKELKKGCDILIHAAAVSDYKLRKPYSKKIKSDRKLLKLELIPTIKIINQCKKWNPKVFLVGFKLESRITKKRAEEEAARLIKKADCDLVIANHVTKASYHGYLINKQGQILNQQNSRVKIVGSLIQAIKRE